MKIKKKPTLDDIAALANVSKSTVSMILNEKKGVSFLDETIQKVNDAAKQLGYNKIRSKNSLNKMLSDKTILVITPNINSPYYSSLIQSIEQTANNNDLNIVIYNTYRDKEKEKSALSIVDNSNIYGVISTITPQSIDRFEEINQKTPVVIISDRNSNFALDTVEISNYGAGVLIAKHMINLGHKKIAYISTTLNKANSARLMRLKGVEDTYREYCPEGSVTVKSNDITPNEELNNINIEYTTGYNLMSELIMDNTDITGIIAVNDMVAYGVMESLYDNNYKIPEDYSLCGFDNLFPSKFSKVSLTTIEHYITNKGQNAVEMLIQRRDLNMNIRSSTKVLYKHKLIVRKSTGKI